MDSENLLGRLTRLVSGTVHCEARSDRPRAAKEVCSLEPSGNETHAQNEQDVGQDGADHRRLHQAELVLRQGDDADDLGKHGPGGAGVLRVVARGRGLRRSFSHCDGAAHPPSRRTVGLRRRSFGTYELDGVSERCVQQASGRLAERDGQLLGRVAKEFLVGAKAGARTG